MDASAKPSRVDESVPSPKLPTLANGQPNVLAVEYLRQPSSSSIAMLRNAFKGLLGPHS